MRTPGATLYRPRMAGHHGLVLAYVVEVVVVTGAVVGLLGWLRRRTRVSYRIAALGAFGFIASQVVHLPLNHVLVPLLPTEPAQRWVSALALGLSAGVCEELARYVLLRTAAKGVRHEGSALMLGAGHGGVGKEWQQLRGSGAAFWTGMLVPVFMLLVIPQTFILALAGKPIESSGDPSPIAFGLIADLVNDPTRVGVAFLPFFITISALIAPTSLITHAIVQERETRTLELLVALPVRIQQVIAAKLASAYLAAMGVCGACLLVLSTELLVFGMASVGELLGVFALLMACTAYATAASLFVALLAKDFRTANNLAGGIIGPAIVLVMVGMLVISGDVLRPLTLALLFALGALALGRAALRAATFERLLE